MIGLIKKGFHLMTVVAVLFVIKLSAQEADYTPPQILNPNGATIAWQSDGSVIVTGGPVEFISGIRKRSFSLDEEILADQMALINLNSYVKSNNDNEVTYGINSKDISQEGNVELKVFNRPHTSQGIPSLINSPPNFGYDFKDNDFMIYGTKTGSDYSQNFKNEEESWNAYGYYAHGWSFSKTQVKSTDFKNLMNRPKNKTWWDTALDLYILIVIVASVILTAGLAAVYEGYIVGFSLSLATLKTLFAGLTLTLLVGITYLSSFRHQDFISKHPEHKYASKFYPQSKFKTGMEVVIPEKIINPVTQNQRNHNKAIDAYLINSIDCHNFPNKKCYKLPLFPVVIKMSVKDAHVKFVNIPGIINKNITPYQLFESYYYQLDENGTIEVTPQTQGLVRKKTSDEFSLESKLPNKFIYSPIEQDITLKFNDFTIPPYLYFLGTKESFNLPEYYYVNLGKFGKLLTPEEGESAEDFYLYRYRANLPVSEGEEPEITITLTPSGPFLAGDNFVLKDPISPGSLKIKVTKPDGSIRGVFDYTVSQSVPDTVKCIMGDKVEFILNSSLSSSSTIEMSGLPATWLAPIGREYYYHCDPSIQPGEIKPKVPFDVQSHYVSSNGAQVERYSEWTQDPSNSNVYSFNWIAQRRTSAKNGRKRYNAQYKFKKADILGTKLQRKSKSEGQIMDLLEVYKDGKKQNSNGGHDYDSAKRKYYWNIDSDELIYLGSKEINTKTPGWSGKLKRVPVYDVEFLNNPYSQASLALPNEVGQNIAKLYEPWQLIREGDYRWNISDGYPESGFLINELVDAYKKHHDVDASPYRGYEIEDFCLYKDKMGNCITQKEENNIVVPGLVEQGAVYNRSSNVKSDNNEHPGLIKIKGNFSYEIPIQVDAPLETDYGFYGNVITPAHSNAGSDVGLKVVGLPKGMDETTQSRYSLKLRSYSLQDFPEDIFKLGTDGSYDSSSGIWTLEKKDIGFEQAWSATLFFNPDPSSSDKEVIVGGAEWKNTNIAYVFTTKDPYGGENCTDCLDLKAGYEEFADNYVQSNRYGYDFSQGFTQTYDGDTFWRKTLRNYTLNVDDKNTRFVSMDALDNIWDMHGNAYYWGYRALAKMITDQQLANELNYTLKNLITGKEEVHRGRFFDFNPSHYGVGDYTLQVSHKDGGETSPFVGIKVVDYKGVDPSDSSKKQKANIYTRDLFSNEKAILGIDNLNNYYKVAYVDDLLATHYYLNGYRADKHDGSKNRFASHNDYREEYVWKTLHSSGGLTTIENIPQAKNAIDSFDPTSYWKPEWINWLRHFSYGKFPNSVVTPAIDQVSDSDSREQIGLLYDDSEYQINDFLRSLIWLAPTDYYGYRINGLMKTIVNLDSFFNDYAFSGSLSPERKPRLPVFINKEQDLSDDTKYRLHFLRALKNGEMIIFNTTQTKDLRVYQQKDAANQIFLASTKSHERIPLTIGQDLQTIEDYGATKESVSDNLSFPIPGGVTAYLNLYNLLNSNENPANDANGCQTKLVDFYGGLGEDPQGNIATKLNPDTGKQEVFYYNNGSGPINARLLADRYPNSELNIGLLITSIYNKCNTALTDIADIAKGNYDNEINRLIKFCKSRSRQSIFLRIGYEFDLVWNNGYEKTEDYKAAFIYIVNKFRANNVNNVSFVWHASASPLNYVDYLAYQKDLPGVRNLFNGRIPHNPNMLEDWYPGNNYVDVIAFSYFENFDSKGPIAVQEFGTDVLTQKHFSDKIVNMAKRHNKRVMIAESTPRGYDLKNLTKTNTHRFWDGPVYSVWNQDPTKRVKAGTVSVTAQEIWNNFYQPLFDYIEDNGDVIKHFHYIVADWTSHLQYAWTSEYQYWGNARVQDNDFIKKKWQNEINKPKWIHGNKFHAPDLAVFDIATNSAKFTWPKNDTPEVAKFVLHLQCIECESSSETNCSNSCPDPIIKVVSASTWKSTNENEFIKIENLLANTNYNVHLHSVDYFGKSIGQIKKTFKTTLMSTGYASAIETAALVEDDSIDLYPNPTNDELNIAFEMEQAGQVTIEITDLSGLLLYSKTELRDKGKHVLHFDNIHNNISVTERDMIVVVVVTTQTSRATKKILIESN